MVPSSDDHTVVWMQSGISIVWAYDMTTGSVKKLADNYMPEPKVSGDVVVFAVQKPGYVTTDIWGYKLSDGTQFPIHVDPGTGASWQQHDPDISGDIVVWADERPTEGTIGGQGEIYGYNLATQTEFPVVAHDGVRQTFPAVSGRYVVWYEWNNYASYFQIRGKNLDTNEFFTVVTGLQEEGKGKLDICGDVVVWTDDRTAATQPDIYGYDISDGRQFPICTAPSAQNWPRVWGGTVIWGDTRDGLSSVRGLDLATSSEFVIVASDAGSP